MGVFYLHLNIVGVFRRLPKGKTVREQQILNRLKNETLKAQTLGIDSTDHFHGNYWTYIIVLLRDDRNSPEKKGNAHTQYFSQQISGVREPSVL